MMAKFDIKELNKNLPNLGGTLGSGHSYVPDDWSMYPLSGNRVTPKPYLIESDIPGKSYWTYDEPGDVSWNTDSTLTNKLWGTNQLPWDDFVKQEKDKTKYNFAANAPDDKEGLAKALAELDGPEPGTGFKPIPKDDQLMTKFDTWESADAWAKQIHNQQAARDTASRSKYNSQLAAAKKRLAAATTDDAKKSAKAAVANAQSGLDFLNKYQVYQGEDHWVNSSQVESEWRQSKDYWDYQNQQDQLAQLPDQDFSDKQGFWTKEQLDSIDPQFLKEDVRVGDPIEGSFSPSGKAFTSGQDSEKSIQTLQRESDLDWLTPETKPAGTNTVPLFLRGIPEKERYKHWDNDPYRDIWNINKLPSSDETLMASADQSNLKINTDTDTDVARAAKQREVIDKNLGFGIAREWETTDNFPSLRDTSTNTESLFIDPANLPSNLEMLDQTIEDNTYTTGDKIKDFAKEFAKNTPEVLGGIAERLASVPVGAIPLGRSMLHTAGWTQGTDDNPMRIDLTPGASREARDRANEYINSLSGTEIAKIRKDGMLSTDQLSQLTTAIQPNQRGTEWNFAMNSLANPRIDLEDDPRNPGGVRVKRVYDNYQFDRESDVSFDLPGKPIQRAVETFQNQNIKNDSLRTTYQLDQSDPGNTRNTRRLPSYHEFSYDLPPGRLGPLPNIKYTGQGQQKYGKNLTGISSNLISPSTGGGSSAMKIQSANKKGFGY